MTHHSNVLAQRLAEAFETARGKKVSKKRCKQLEPPVIGFFNPTEELSWKNFFLSALYTALGALVVFATVDLVDLVRQ